MEVKNGWKGQGAEALIEWLEEEDILFRLSQKEAVLLLGYLEGSGWSLETEAENLFLCDDVLGTREKTDIDAVVDKVCETNYELFEQTAMKLGQTEIYEDTEEIEDYLSSLAEDEKILDEVFKRTKYQKQVQRAIMGIGEPKMQKEAVTR